MLVTGASSGIGRELCRELAARRASRLILVARREAELRSLADELGRLGVSTDMRPTDLGDPAAVAALAGSLASEPVDALCLAAGFGDYGLFDRAEWPRISTMVQVNLLSVLHLVHAVLPGMVTRGHGDIMVLTSGSGHTAMPMSAVYATTKHALAGFCANLRLDVTGTGVTVVEVAPGPVPTGFDAAAGADDGLAAPLPEFMVIDAAQCAREALDGLERGRPLVWPGRAYRALMTATGFLPRPVLRAVFSRSGRVAAQERARRDKLDPRGETGARVPLSAD